MISKQTQLLQIQHYSVQWKAFKPSSLEAIEGAWILKGASERFYIQFTVNYNLIFNEFFFWEFYRLSRRFLIVAGYCTLLHASTRNKNDIYCVHQQLSLSPIKVYQRRISSWCVVIVYPISICLVQSCMVCIQADIHLNESYIQVNHRGIWRDRCLLTNSSSLRWKLHPRKVSKRRILFSKYRVLSW